MVSPPDRESSEKQTDNRETENLSGRKAVEHRQQSAQEHRQTQAPNMQPCTHALLSVAVQYVAGRDSILSDRDPPWGFFFRTPCHFSCSRVGVCALARAACFLTLPSACCCACLLLRVCALLSACFLLSLCLVSCPASGRHPPAVFAAGEA